MGAGGPIRDGSDEGAAGRREAAESRLPVGLRLPAGLRLFVAISLTLSVVAWVAAMVPGMNVGAVGKLPFVADDHHFSDFWVFYERFQELHTAGFFAPRPYHFSYFPAAVPLYAAFYRFGLDVGLDTYFALASGSVLLGAVLFGRGLVRAGLGRRSAAVLLTVTVLCAFPVIFAVERGNFEVLLSVGVTAGVWAMVTGRRRLAAVLWGVFGAVKLYPLLLGGLFAARRRYFGLLGLMLGTAAVVTLLALVFTGPTFAAAWAGLRGGPAAFVADFTLVLHATEWDHSLFAVVKVLALRHGRAVASLLRPYYLLAGSTMLVVYVVRIRRLPLPNQVVALLVSLVLLPPTSFEYTLTALYGAWGVLAWLAVTAAAEGRAVRGVRPALGLLAVLFSPLRLVTRHGVGYGGQVQCGLLVALLVVALWQPWPLPRAAEAGARLDTREAGAAL